MGDLIALEAGGRHTRLYTAGGIQPGTPGVVVFHAWWGLNDDLMRYADRIAGAGFAVFAPDLYRGPVATTIEAADSLSSALDEADADVIALAAVDLLVARIGPEASLGALGFSLGTAWAMWTAAERGAIRGSVVYYGTISGPALRRASVPVLGHFAEDDPFEPDESVTAFEGALRDAGRDATIHRYAGTGHWFAEPSRDEYRAEAADLALARTIDFLRRTLTAVAG